MRRFALACFLLVGSLGPPACGPASDPIPPAAQIKDTRTEEAKEADDSMQKHFKKFGNR